MKKSSDRQLSSISDQKRLRALTTPFGPYHWSADGETFPKYVCGYELGCYIIINSNRQSVLVEGYRLGHKADETTHRI